jgi:hypothetical protein
MAETPHYVTIVHTRQYCVHACYNSTAYMPAITLLRKGMIQENLVPKQFCAHSVLGKFDSTTVNLNRILARR